MADGVQGNKVSAFFHRMATQPAPDKWVQMATALTVITTIAIAILSILALTSLLSPATITIALIACGAANFALELSKGAWKDRIVELIIKGTLLGLLGGFGGAILEGATLGGATLVGAVVQPMQEVAAIVFAVAVAGSFFMGIKECCPCRRPTASANAVVVQA